MSLLGAIIEGFGEIVLTAVEAIWRERRRPDIEFGRPGRIRAGPQTGWFMRIDEETNGGRLRVALGGSRSLERPEAVEWYQNFAHLEKEFLESGWKVEWLDA